MMIPKELMERDQWVCWKLFDRDRNGKLTKVPFQPNGTPASSTDSKTWRRFADCLKVEDSFAGVGFVFSGTDGLIGVDLDGCRDPETGMLSDWAREILEHIDTYTEVSPSKTGVKMFGYASKPWAGINKKELGGLPIGDKHPGIEIYDRARYFAVTGECVFNRNAVQNIDAGLAWLEQRHGLQKVSAVAAPVGITQQTPLKERAAKYVEKMDASVSGQGGHNSAFKAACVLVKGFGLSVDDAYQVFVTAFNNRCQPPWSEREIQHKLNSAANQPGSSGYLAEALPEQWSKVQIPSSYKYTPPPKMQPAKEEEKPSVRRTTIQAAAAKYLDSIADGQQPLYETGIPQLDEALGGGVADGEMVIIAARPSHGKSAIALQICHKFTELGYPVGIISEEMSALQLGKRTIQYISARDERDWGNQIEKMRLEIAKHFIGRADAYIAESCGTVENACREIESMKSEHGIKAAFVDYAQILTGQGRDRYTQVTSVSQTLRQLASRLQIPVFVLAQLSREIERRDKFMPTMKDLKESGQLEQDADAIVFAVWPHRLDSSIPKNQYQLFIGKNRNRGIKKYALHIEFNAERQMLIDQQVEINEDFASWG